MELSSGVVGDVVGSDPVVLRALKVDFTFGALSTQFLNISKSSDLLDTASELFF